MIRKKKANIGTASRPRKRPKAATRDILGAPVREARINPKWRSHYQHLTELRNHFLKRKETLVRDANEETPNFSQHMADAGTDTYDRDWALSMLSSEQNALYEIEQALNRIRKGTYGICELTGKPIHPARLAAIPWTRFSIEAEKQLESRGELERTRLGPLGSIEKAEAETGEEPEEAES